MKGVYQHGSTWKVNTTIKRKRVVRCGFTSRVAAERWLADRRAGRPEGAPETTVGDVVRFYLEHRRCKTEDRNRQLAAHVLRHLGERPAQSLRQVDADDYVAARAAEGAAPKTAWNELAMARTALRYAWRNDIVPELPRFTLSKPRCARRRVAWQSEAQQLVVAAPLPLRRVVLAAWTRGMRRSEIIGARREWLHGNVLLLPTTKSGAPKEVPLSPALLAMLDEEPRHDVWLFAAGRSGRNGKGKLEAVPWTRTQLRRAWAALCESCGVEGLTLHDLRRSMASVALSLGHAPAAVQAVGGWADQVALMRHYSHALSAQARAVGDDLERLALGVAGETQVNAACN